MVTFVNSSKEGDGYVCLLQEIEISELPDDKDVLLNEEMVSENENFTFPISPCGTGMSELNDISLNSTIEVKIYGKVLHY